VVVGCNDLLQQLCAANRDDPQQRVLLDPYRPELFRFLKDGALQAGSALAQMQLCGLFT
jgi:phosphoenolpyruvate-protein kinase (PTS system EI component)